MWIPELFETVFLSINEVVSFVLSVETQDIGRVGVRLFCALGKTLNFSHKLIIKIDYYHNKISKFNFSHFAPEWR